MRIPTGQKRVLTAMGKGFEPRTEIEIARRVYPNHAAWEEMGESGAWAWRSLVSKVSNMLGSLNTRGLVWQVGSSRWTTSNKFNVAAVQDYWDWLAVCCDALDGEGELYDDAVDAIYWYIVHFCSKWRRPAAGPRDYGVILMCVRAALSGMVWPRDGRLRELHYGVTIVDLGVRELVKDKALTSEQGSELRDAIRKRQTIWSADSKTCQTFEELVKLLETHIPRPPTAANTGSVFWAIPKGASTDEKG